MPYVISTSGNDTEYTEYRTVKENKDIRNTPIKSVIVKGGQGVMRRKELFTPNNGVVTEVSPEDAEFLANHPVFKKHALRGFVRLVNYQPDDKRAAKELETMEKEDDSAQLTPEDFGAEAAAVEEGGAELKISGKKVAAKVGRPSRKRSKF